MSIVQLACFLWYACFGLFEGYVLCTSLIHSDSLEVNSVHSFTLSHTGKSMIVLPETRIPELMNCVHL